MVEQGYAKCIMGNHEFNAIAWATQNEEGRYLREHSDKNYKQHQAFLTEAEADPDWYSSTIEWFKTLPIYLDLSELRVVHACWHQPSLEALDKYTNPDGSLKEDAWIAATTKGHELYRAIEVLSKGWEVPLPDGFSFLDKDKNPRTEIRARWRENNDTSYQSLAIGVEDPDTLPNKVIPSRDMPGYYNKKPLFIGHYWMKGAPCLQSKMIVCVDWSVADNGSMVGYRLMPGELSEAEFYEIRWV